MADLRAWAADVASRTSNRKFAKRVGMSVEGVRQFIRGDTAPQERTRRKLGEAYLGDLEERSPERELRRPDPEVRRVAEPAAGYPGGLEAGVRRLFAGGRERALRRVEAIFAGRQDHRDAAALRELLLRWIDERWPPGTGTAPARRKRK